jgi:enamine deaminase RidA (YjgF/YER057c/UK114 family)
MRVKAEERIRELGIELPVGEASPNELANEQYDAHVLPSYIAGDLLFLAGQVPMKGRQEFYKGRLGVELSVEEGYQAARICAINALADMKRAIGDLDKVIHVVRVIGFINSAPSFTDHPKVLNGCSDLLIDVFGERGWHTRAAIGVTGMASGHSIETLITVHVGR